MKGRVAVLACIACVALGLGAGWLAWRNPFHGNGVYAGMSQDTIERTVVGAVNLDASNQGDHDHAIDANCNERRFEKNVFDCNVTWDHGDYYGFRREWTARFVGTNLVDVKNTSQFGG